MRDLNVITGVAKVLAVFFGYHAGAVLAAGTAEGDGQIALAFMDIVRQEVDEEIGDARNELAGLRERANIFRDAGIASRQGAKFRDKVRVRQEAHIEDQVGVLRNALAESEAHARY